MRNSFFVITACLYLFASVQFGCKKEEIENQPPTCEITTPANNSEFDKGETITINVEANDSDGSINEVRFYIDEIGVFSAASFPYKYEWVTVEETIGEHDIKVIAYDNEGLQTEKEIVITLTANLPVVLTGEFSRVRAETFTLNGEITSDGGDKISEKGFYVVEGNYSTLESILSDGNKIISSDQNSNFSFDFSDGTRYSKYVFVAFATNSIGTSYGSIVDTLTYWWQDKGTFIDSRDNNDYNWVQVGDQIWMAENLAFLPEVNSSTNEYGGYWVYDYNGTNVTEAKNTLNYKTHGSLYSFEMAKNVCPAGWHLPSDEEWIELERYIGIMEEQLYYFGARNHSDNNNFILLDIDSFSSYNWSLHYEDGDCLLIKPSGSLSYYIGGYAGLGNSYSFLTSTMRNNEQYITRYGTADIVDLNGRGSTLIAEKPKGHSVRCVKNY